jgi:quercetin dioxygenase-like cupin family protein
MSLSKHERMIKMSNEVFEAFNKGSLQLPTKVKTFDNIPWSKHPTFKGVELKHILTSDETGDAFSYHLVHIEPNCSIMSHVHNTQLETHEVIAGSGTCENDGVTLPYESGSISIFPIGIPHAVNASKDGLYLFAKFFPALC